MKVVPKKHRAEFVEPPLSDARERRMWNEIDARLQQRRHVRTRWLAPTFAAVVLVAAALLLVLRAPLGTPLDKPVATAAEVVVSGETDQILSFADGSSLALHPHTELVMLAVSEQRVHVRLERGGVGCTVRDGSSAPAFTLEAGTTRVALEPGHYEIARASDGIGSVHVEAQRGRASVRTAEGALVATLNAGEHWSEAEVSRVAGWVSAPASAAAPLPSAPPPPKPEPPKPPPSDASQIFARGERARLEGQSDEAAQAFDQLYRTFPADPRAPIAALESGRLHLRGTGNLRSAVSALTFARANAQEPFREDAHAGLVEALARSGQVGACQSSRDDFLAAYPKSPHRDKVAARCP